MLEQIFKKKIIFLLAPWWSDFIIRRICYIVIYLFQSIVFKFVTGIMFLHNYVAMKDDILGWLILFFLSKFYISQKFDSFCKQIEQKIYTLRQEKRIKMPLENIFL